MATNQVSQVQVSQIESVESAALSHLEKSYNNKPMVYLDPADSCWVIRNSKIGTCPRELWAAWKGMEPARDSSWSSIPVEEVDPNAINSDPAAEGHLHEAHVKQLLQEKGWVLSGFELEFVLRVGNCKIVGHADMGSAIDPVTGTDYFGEVKSMGKQAFDQFLSDGWDMFPTYMVQLSVGMIATGKPGIVWVKCRDNGRILPPFIFTEPPVTRSYVMRKVLQIKQAVDLDVMPLCGAWRKTNGFCKYTQLHDEEQYAPADQVAVPDMEYILQLYKQLGQTTQVFQDPVTKQPEKGPKGKWLTETAKRKQLREIIEQKLTNLNTSAILSGKFQAIKSSGKLGFDEARFKEEHPALWLAYKTKQGSGQLRVVEVGKDDGKGDEGDE